MNKFAEYGIKILPGVAALPEGFSCGAAPGGIREEGRLDVGVLFSELPCASAGVYTRNAVKAAPLLVTREAIEGGDVRAVVANSGNANAATGERGIADARRMQEVAAEALGVGAEEVAVASTGVVGEYLPMEKVARGIRGACEALGRGGEGFARAILTTDTRTKGCVARCEVSGRDVEVWGVAKGSGMIHPNMGTMLAFLATDAAVEKKYLQELLREATRRTFNRVTVDGDTSPNDMAIALANGAAGNVPVAKDSPDHPAFAAAVEGVMRHLAREIARDGEGATKLIEVSVEGARDEESAAALARAVAGSNLVKAAVFGEDANWGRVLVAMGYSGAPFDPGRVEIRFGDVVVFSGGEPAAYDEAEAGAALSGEEVRISARLDEGDGSAEAWGCDLTHGYVEINGSYRT